MTFHGYQESTPSFSGPGTTHTVDWPTTIDDQDLLILHGAWNANNTITLHADWTRLANNLAGNPGTIEVWGRIASGSGDGGREGSTFDITSSASQAGAFNIRRYSGHTGGLVAGTDYDIDPGSWAEATNPDPPSNTSAWGSPDDTTWVAIGSARGDNVAATGAPTNYGNLASSEATNGGGGGASTYSADRQLDTATEDPGTFTLASSERTFTYTLALKGPDDPSITPERAGVAAGAREPTAPQATAAVPERAGVRAGLRAPEVYQPPPADFPDATLDVRAELEINGVWTDISTRLLAQQLEETRGRPDESSLTEPSAVAMILDNADGHLTPDNPNSPWWPYIDQGTKLRLSVRAGAPALVIGGGNANSRCSTPDHVDFSVTDLDVRVRLQPDAWSHGVTWSGDSPVLADIQRIASKWEAATDDRSWNLMLFGGGWPAIEWSIDGTQSGAVFRKDEDLIAALRPIWTGFTVDTNDGAGSYLATTWINEDETPDSDITTWTPVSTYTGAASVIADTDADVVLGSIVEASGVFNGRILEAEFRDAINGAIVADPNFTIQEVGASIFQDSTGKTWTVQGPGAEISNWRLRFVGSLDELIPFWPHGDNNPQDPEDLAGETITLWSAPDVQASEHRLAVTANGILRRLGQGQDPLSSPLRRHITSPRLADRIAAYWPCEDVTGAVRLAAGLPGHSDMTFSGTGETGANADLISSAPLPTISSDNEATFSGQVVSGNDAAWAVDWVWRMETPEISPTLTRLITIRSAGDVAEWHLSLNDTNMALEGYDPEGVKVISSFGGVAPEYHTGWVLGRLQCNQAGDDVEWAWKMTALDTGIIYGIGAALTTYTLGRVTGINTTTTGPDDGYSFGHIVVSDGSLDVGWLSGADTAWVGESAAHRFWRICTEEDIEVEIYGDPGVALGGRGDLALSEAMGPQEQLTLLELLDHCVAVDLGVMAERPRREGFIYRTRRTLQNQAVRMTLDAANNEITHPLEPRKDDQRIRNDITVAAIRGSAAREIDQASIDFRRRYREEVSLAGIGGVFVQEGILETNPGMVDAVASQNRQQAGWRVHLGTWPGMRYPSVAIPLDVAPDQIEYWLDLALGDRVQLINLPAQVPDDIIDLLVEATLDLMTPQRWIPELTCSPAGIWELGVLT
ncbi:hypothetical protein [Herbaspirillum sp.]|uniref:hypothetical protein n=1 Tax=Herbaspirillum sp. TaxID=1890675 RepID=UPI002590F31C|nr:hypothetical protein [Herbaspirillum sp.]MCP3949440.1 hypothetical protein [Herbaspirillum sp.]